MQTVLEVTAGLDEYTRFVAVLVAYAESDFESGAVQRDTVGVYQQNPKWWPSATKGTEAQCRAFLDDFKANAKYHNGNPVHDAWVTQRWQVPNGGLTWPNPGPNWLDSPETQNYVQRLPKVAQILTDGHL